VLIPRAPLVLITLFVQGHRRDVASGSAGVFDLASERPNHHGRAAQYANSESHRRIYCRLDHHPLDLVRLFRIVPQPVQIGRTPT